MLVVLLLLCSCTKKEETKIVITYDSAQDAAEAVGFASPEYIPDGFDVSEYNVIYGIVSETVYVSGEERGVLRVVNGEYSVSNLSGYLDTSLSDVYTSRDGREFEIEFRDSVYAVEWIDNYLGEEYNFSFTLSGCELSQFKKNIEDIIASIKAEAS